MQENIKKILEGMRNQPEGMAVQQFLKEKIEELSYLRGIQGSIEEKGRIVEARQEAIKTLQSLFSFLEPVKIQNNKPKYN